MFYAFLNNKMNFNAFIYIFYILKFSYSTSSEICSKSNTLWHSLKYPYLNLLENFKLQTTPFTCSLSTTTNCCNSDKLKEMSSISEIKLKGLAEDKIEFLLMMFSNDSYFLMNMITNDLENTKNDLNTLFSTTYGYNYKVEKDFFFNWFEKLKLYMEGKKHNIGQLLDDFFLEMAQKIVKILIPPESGPEVTKCQIARLIESKPYQGIDADLKKKIISSYSPARLLVNAIAVGRDAFKKLMQKTTPSANCLEQFNTQFHCMLCNGLAVKSCPITCKSVMDNCFGSFKLAELKKLDKILNKYINAVIALASKLDNPLNFPAVNHKMNVQISTAIMNVQNTYPNIKEQIKAKCQTDGAMSRKKRQASQEILNWQTNTNGHQPPFWERKLDDNMKSNIQKKNLLSSQGSKLNDFLSPFSRTIKTKYKALEGYFLKIVPDYCTVNSDSLDSVQCWNVTSVQNSGISLEKNNKKNNKSTGSIFKSVTNQIKEITNRINEFLKDKTPDPETIQVEEFILYKSKQENKFVDKNFKTSQSPIEGSGDLDKFPIQPSILPPKKKPEIVNPPPILKPVPDENEQENNNKNVETPVKNPKFPPWEGSGDAEEGKSDPDKEKSSKSLKKSSTPRPKTMSTASVQKIVTQSSTESNLNTDDEDMISKQPKGVPDKPATTSSLKPDIVPEGSGLDPDLTPSKQPPRIVEQPTTTTKPTVPDKSIEGSGSEVEPGPDTEKQRPAFPKVPENTGVSTKSPKEKDSKLNPDEEKNMEGSGRAPVNQFPTSKSPTISDSTLSPTKPLPPDQYPGTIPSEVWIPGIDGAKNADNKDNQKTTPGNRANRNKNQRSTITKIIITLSLLLIFTA